MWAPIWDNLTNTCINLKGIDQTSYPDMKSKSFGGDWQGKIQNSGLPRPQTSVSRASRGFRGLQIHFQRKNISNKKSRI